ncbi:MAG TPA: hypothetical protein VFX96_08100, partial [Pyrinomonadaceae bacterium]|nr:hypothetical protein [Pyrinomonadaceae bacterium]
DTLSIIPALTFGFVLGLKHAVEADHLAAVSAIVSERKSLLGSALVGGLWGVGHTVSLVAVGACVVLLGIRLDGRAATLLEFCVGLMLVALGADALRKLARGGRIHLHAHRHGGREHVHPHLHAGARDEDSRHEGHAHEDSAHEGGAHKKVGHDEDAHDEDAAPTHHGLRLDARTLAVGMLHGLAGSATLMLLVLSKVESPFAALLFIAVFGVGSIGGMMLMSALVGLPLHLTASRFNRANVALRGAAGLFSVAFGLAMVYEIGFAGNLFR